MNTASKVLRPSLHFLGLRKSAFAELPYIFKYVMLEI